MDVLNRQQAPINEAEWEDLTSAVVRVARRQLIGRRWIALFGPVGAGQQTVSVDRTPSWDLAQVTMQTERRDQVADQRRYQRMVVLAKDFVLDWRDLELARTHGDVLDWSKAEAAASYVALSEDHLIFHGRPEEGLDGLLTVEGRHVLPTEGWDEPGGGFRDVARAVSHLTSAGFVPPYTVVVGVTLYAAWHRLYGNSGVLEVDEIRQLVGGGVYQSPLVPDDSVLVVAMGAENLDVALGLDLNVAFVESTGMNYIFRVLETLSLRIKRPGAVCQISQQS